MGSYYIQGALWNHLTYEIITWKYLICTLIFPPLKPSQGQLAAYHQLTKHFRAFLAQWAALLVWPPPCTSGESPWGSMMAMLGQNLQHGTSKQKVPLRKGEKQNYLKQKKYIYIDSQMIWCPKGGTWFFFRFGSAFFFCEKNGPPPKKLKVGRCEKMSMEMAFLSGYLQFFRCLDA